MVAATRPPLEPLSDLPVEEPQRGTSQARTPPHAASQKATAQRASAAGAPAPEPPKDPAQSGLNFVVPELYLAGSEPTETPAAAPAAARTPSPGIDSTLEVMLEDPIVDEMLLNSAAASSPATPAPAAAPAPPAAPELTLSDPSAPVVPAGPVPAGGGAARLCGERSGSGAHSTRQDSFPGRRHQARGGGHCGPARIFQGGLQACAAVGAGARRRLT